MTAANKAGQPALAGQSAFGAVAGPREALDTVIDALRVRSGSADFGSPEDEGLMERAAEACVTLGRSGEAEALLRAITERPDKNTGREGVSRAWLHRAHLAVSDGRLEAAGAFIEQALGNGDKLESMDLAMGPLRAWAGRLGTRRGSSFAAQALLQMGRLLAGLGQFASADVCCVVGAELLTSRSSLARRMDLLRAQWAFEAGNLEEVRRFLRQCTDEDELLTPAGQVQVAELAARAADARGDLGGALEAQMRAVWWCRRAGSASSVLRASANVAWYLVSIGQFARASSIARQVLGHYADPSLIDANVRNTCGAVFEHIRLYRQLRESTATLSVYQSMQSTLPAGGIHLSQAAEATPGFAQPPSTGSFLERFLMCAHQVMNFCNTQAIDAAREGTQYALDLFGASDSRLILTCLQLLEAGVSAASGAHGAARGKLAGAAEMARLACQTLECMGYFRLARSARQSADHWALLAGQDPAEVIGSLSAGDAIDLAMTRSLPIGERAAFLAGRAHIEQDQLRARLAIADRETGTSRRAAIQEFVDWVSRADVIRAQCLSSRNGAWVEQEPGAAGSRPSRRLTSVNRPDVRLRFIVLPEQCWALVGRDTDWELVRTGFDAAQLNIGVAGLMNALRYSGSHTLGQPGRLQDLHHAAALVAKMVGIDRLIEPAGSAALRVQIISDNPLMALPWAMLPFKGAQLIDHAAVSIAFGVDAAALVSRTQASQRLPAGRSALIVGIGEAPDTGPGPQPDLALPWARVEAEEVAERARKWGLDVAGCPLFDRRASREEVLRRLPDAAFLHAACHGVVDPDVPERSGLLLLGHDGKEVRLTAQDVASVNLQHLRLATLSSCWSGDLLVAPGRWAVGLAESLHYAGAQRILASLWPVFDLISRPFVGAVYDHVTDLGAAAALRAAQLATRDGSLIPNLADATRDPFCWAGAVLYGDDSAVEWS